MQLHLQSGMTTSGGDESSRVFPTLGQVSSPVSGRYDFAAFASSSARDDAWQEVAAVIIEAAKSISVSK